MATITSRVRASAHPSFDLPDRSQQSMAAPFVFCLSLLAGLARP
mgnify:CR=1 FL=1